METRKCKDCGEHKPLSEFYTISRKRSPGKVYYNTYCKVCNQIRHRRWVRDNPERNKRNQDRWNSDNRGYQSVRHRCKKYGFTKDELARFLAEKAGVCEICGRHESDFAVPHNIDHDHETGEVRGLLCTSCNRALGYFQDNPSVLERALEYLRHRKGTAPA